jgi:diaminopimelate epimerase
MKLAKWHGLGNDYLVVEEASLPAPLTREAIVLLCDRHLGVGSDGILLRCQPTGAVPGAPTRMRIFNPDGGEVEMCGNGIRIFARYLEASGAVAPGSEFTVETLAGPITPRLLGEGMVRVDMGLARFVSLNIDLTKLAPAAPGSAAAGGADSSAAANSTMGGVVDQPLEAAGGSYRFTFVDVGNPHCVIVVDDPAAIDLPVVGRAIEHHPVFPNRVNVEFIHPEADGSVSMRVWERGVGETQACGTGATAVGAAAVRLGLATSPVTVHLLGGDLGIEVEAPGGPKPAGGSPAEGAADQGRRVFKTGPAEEIFTCELGGELLRRLGWPAPAAD